MGRYKFTALRVRRRALQSLQSRQTTARPPWLDIVGEIPPAQVFVRKQPQRQFLEKIRMKQIEPSREESQPKYAAVVVRTEKKPRPKELYKPLPIRFEEDELRKRFYKDHPWELARPRIVLENDGKDYEKVDWSTGIAQHAHGKKLDGESVVQRQLHLLTTSTPSITTSQAYDIARREFYDARQQEDIERRIAIEEALYTGAQFQPDAVHHSMALEDKMYDEWEKWARQEVIEKEQRRAAFAGATGAQLGSASASEDDGLAELDQEEEERQAAEEGDGIKNVDESRRPLGAMR